MRKYVSLFLVLFCFMFLIGVPGIDSSDTVIEPAAAQWSGGNADSGSSSGDSGSSSDSDSGSGSDWSGGSGSSDDTDTSSDWSGGNADSGDESAGTSDGSSSNSGDSTSGSTDQDTSSDDSYSGGGAGSDDTSDDGSETGSSTGDSSEWSGGNADDDSSYTGGDADSDESYSGGDADSDDSGADSSDSSSDEWTGGNADSNETYTGGDADNDESYSGGNADTGDEQDTGGDQTTDSGDSTGGTNDGGDGGGSDGTDGDNSDGDDSDSGDNGSGDDGSDEDGSEDSEDGSDQEDGSEGDSGDNQDSGGDGDSDTGSSDSDDDSGGGGGGGFISIDLPDILSSEIVASVSPQNVQLGESVTISGEIRDEDGPGQRVEIFVDGDRVSTVVAEDDGGFSTSYTASEIGRHDVRIEVDDVSKELDFTVSSDVSISRIVTSAETRLGQTISVCPEINSQTEADVTLYRNGEEVGSSSGTGRVCFSPELLSGENVFEVVASVPGDEAREQTVRTADMLDARITSGQEQGDGEAITGMFAEVTEEFSLPDVSVDFGDLSDIEWRWVISSILGVLGTMAVLFREYYAI